ncbi:MAG: hypothetical protein ACYDEN_01995 [Acidimicrobiales bacterium]
MLALVVTLLAVVALLGALVTGLLRSHADIVRALHDLGGGVGDPGGAPRPAPLRLPPLPAERSATVHDLEGITPGGDAVVVATGTSPVTLLAFLTAGCSSCAGVWDGLGDPAQRRAFSPGTRFVAVTKGPEWETPAAVAARAPRDVTVVMSTQAWADYEVPGAPYVVLVDGARGIRLGEGVGRGLAEIAGLAGQAEADARPAGPSRGRAAALGLDGAQREAHNDAALRAAGILPGDPSLYPRSLDDVFPTR